VGRARRFHLCGGKAGEREGIAGQADGEGSGR
jgi:hypothetical protein